MSAGHRFPTGLALDRAGELFVSDNQGNYNPFNEINHVRPGVHFGFINALDKSKPAPPLTPPAIDIPHPWTRSVNGICFLDTPPALRTKLGRDVFGPLEGHLIGCEYDTRRLIRMSLQRVGDTFQGAAYPLSIPPQDLARGFQGPIVCAVSPRVSCTSAASATAWLAPATTSAKSFVCGSNRTSSPAALPRCVLAVTASRSTSSGRSISSARRFVGQLCPPILSRESTPAYGAPTATDGRRKIAGVTVAPDASCVTLHLPELRAGFVYEFRLKNSRRPAVSFTRLSVITRCGRFRSSASESCRLTYFPRCCSKIPSSFSTPVALRCIGEAVLETRAASRHTNLA